MNIARDAARALALAVFAVASGAFAQSFPSRPVRIVVPFPPGGGADALARIMQPSLTRIWGQPILIENKPGASGHIGADFVAAADPDGHTLLMSSTASLTEKNVASFAPVTLVSASPYVVVVNPQVPALSVKELVAYAKKNPGKLSFGSSGTGAASHLAAELFKSLAGIDMLHVPYKGSTGAITGLLSGDVAMMSNALHAVLPQVKAGKLNAIAVGGAKRSHVAPDIPTFVESGYPDFDVDFWYGLLAPAATPKEIIAKLNQDITQVLNAPEMREKLSAQGLEPVTGTPEQFAELIRNDLARWAKVIKTAGITAE